MDIYLDIKTSWRLTSLNVESNILHLFFVRLCISSNWDCSVIVYFHMKKCRDIGKQLFLFLTDYKPTMLNQIHMHK